MSNDTENLAWCERRSESPLIFQQDDDHSEASQSAAISPLESLPSLGFLQHPIGSPPASHNPAIRPMPSPGTRAYALPSNPLASQFSSYAFDPYADEDYHHPEYQSAPAGPLAAGFIAFLPGSMAGVLPQGSLPQRRGPPYSRRYTSTTAPPSPHGYSSQGLPAPIPRAQSRPQQILGQPSDPSRNDDYMPNTPGSGTFSTPGSFSRYGSSSASPTNDAHSLPTYNRRISAGHPSSHPDASSSSRTAPTYHIGQIISTTSSVFEPLFLACLDASPCHVSTADLVAYQSAVIRASKNPDKSEGWRPCIVAEIPASTGGNPKVYLLTTFASNRLSDVPDPIAHWAVPINTTGFDAGDGIDTTPTWSARDDQWVIPFAFRPTHVQRRTPRTWVDKTNLNKLRKKAIERAQAWRLALESSPEPPVGSSWRLMRDPSPRPIPTQEKVNAVGQMATGSAPLTFEQRQEYFTHASNANFHQTELAHIRELLAYHKRRALELDPTSGSLNTRWIRHIYSSHHETSIQELTGRESGAEYNMNNHSSIEQELWASFPIGPEEVALRSVVVGTPVAPSGSSVGDREAAVASSPAAHEPLRANTSTEPSSPVANQEADVRISPTAELQHTMVAPTRPTRSLPVIPDATIEEAEVQILQRNSHEPRRNFVHPLLGVKVKSVSLPERRFMFM
ncbi:hypothetical protein B0H19DRAFT_1241068 [Mycena capillaripes]|nr:hypothetical protein B0H19DRAFT_1241068 [Mycena capillaripes]